MSSLSYEGLREAVETAKRILSKEEIDRQLEGQSNSALFMNVTDNTGCNQKAVSFYSWNVLDINDSPNSPPKNSNQAK